MGGVEPGHRHRSRHGRGPPTGGGTPATGRDLDRGRGSPPRAGVHPDPRADPHPSRPTGRASGTDRHAPLPAGDTNVQLATFLSLTVPGGDEPSSGFHSQHAFVRRPRSWGRPPPPPRLRRAAQHLPARGDRARPARSRLPSGRSCQRPPGRLTFPSQTAARAVRTAGSAPGTHAFPGRRGRGAGAGAARLPGGLGQSCSTKGQWLGARGGRARLLPRSRRSGRRQLRSPPGPGMRTPARPGAHAAAARAGDARPAAGLRSPARRTLPAGV